MSEDVRQAEADFAQMMGNFTTARPLRLPRDQYDAVRREPRLAQYHDRIKPERRLSRGRARI